MCPCYGCSDTALTKRKPEICLYFIGVSLCAVSVAVICETTMAGIGGVLKVQMPFI